MKTFQIYGERCSGTNYVEKLITENFNLVLIEGTHKHWYVNDYSKLRGDTLVIVVVRNPYSFLSSLHLQPHHAPLHYGLSFSEFIRKEWVSYDSPDILPLWFEEDMSIRETIAKPEWIVESEANVCRLRSSKLRNFLELEHHADNFCLLKYEELLLDRNNIRVLKKWGVTQRWNEIKPIVTYKGLGYKVYEPTKYDDIAVDDLQFINDNLDWELENKVGYSPITP